MTLLQLVLRRIIQIYIVQGLVFALFIILIYKCMKKSRKPPMIYFSSFYLSIAIGLFFNFLYAPLNNINLILILNFLTNYFITLGAIFLTVFCISVYKTHNFGTYKQISLILIYAILLFLMILIPNGVRIDESTEWSPHWSVYLFLYLFCLSIIMGFIPTLYYSIKINQSLNDQELKRRWKFFIIGTTEYYTIVIVLFLSNTLNILIFRIIMLYITLILSITGSIFTYYGVGRKF